MDKGKLLETVKKLKQEKRKFSQAIELVVTLKSIDLKKENVNFFITLPHRVREKKICLFSEKSILGGEKIFNRVVTKDQFSSLDKKESKKLAHDNDFFVSQAPVMASVAASFGRMLGPLGKMPSPAIGSVVTKLDDSSLHELVERLNRTVHLRTLKNDTSLKLAVGNQSMSEEHIVENILATEDGIITGLPKGAENIKGFVLKTTMGKPTKLNL